MNASLVDDEYIRSSLDKFSDMVYRIALNYLKNIQDAEDITQEVFLALACRNIIEDDEHLKAWLIRVTINKSINLWNKKKRRKEVIDNELLTSIQSTEIDLDVLYALNRLSSKDRSIIYLFYYEGYSAKEIGDLLAMNEKAVAKRISRARKKLKYYLM